MKHLIRTFIHIALAALLAAAPVYASNKDSVIDDTKPGTIIMDYKDDVARTEPVVGAEFTAYRVAELGTYGQYISMIDGISEDVLLTAGADTICEDVLAAYANGSVSEEILTRTTNENGIAAFNDLRHGLYLIVESRAAARHTPSEPVLVGTPYTEKYTEKNDAGEEVSYNYWEYTTYVFPKPHKTGELMLTKTVKGTGGEKDREFHFKVTLSAEGTYTFKSSNGKTGQMKSGDVLALKDGESVTIEGIPVGVSYKVTENEANADGYRTKSSGTEGKIQYKAVQSAEFLNSRDKVTPTPKQSITPTPSEGTTPPRVRTGDVRAVAVWVLTVVVGVVLFLFSIRKSERPRE